MGLLDKILGRTRQVAEQVAEKGAEVAGEALDKGREVAAEGLDKAAEAMHAASAKLGGEQEEGGESGSQPPKPEEEGQ